MSPVAEGPAETSGEVLDATPKSRRFGLASRLALAFAGAVLMIALAAFVAWRLLTGIGEQQKVLADHDLPRLSKAFRVADQSARIVAKAPEFVSIETEDERALVRGELDQLDVRLTLLIQEMKDAPARKNFSQDSLIETLFGWLGQADDKHLSDDESVADKNMLRTLDDFSWGMTATLDQLDELASERIALDISLRELSFDASHESRRMNRRLAVLRDDLFFFLQTGWSTLDDAAPAPEGERSSPAVTTLADTYSDIAVYATRAASVLTEAAGIPSPGILAPMHDRFDAAMENLRRANRSLSGTENALLLEKPIKGFDRLALGYNGVFATRQRLFAAREREQVLLTEAREIAISVAAAADALVKNAEGKAQAAADHSEHTVKLGVKVLLGLIALAAIAAFLIGWIYIGQGIVRRVQLLSAAMRRMAAGDMDTPAPVSGDDEITDMAESLEVFRQHAREVARLNTVEQLAEELQAQNEILEDTLTKLGLAEAETKALARFPEENPNPVLRLSSDRTVLYANSAARAVPGMTRPGMRAANEIGEAATQAFISGGSALITFETGARAFMLTAAAVPGENYINIYGREITEERRAQAQIMAQEKMASLGQLTAGIAHEIKNPLNFVNNFAKLSNELLEDLTAEVDRVKDAIEADAREEIVVIVEDLTLNLSRIEEHGRRADSIVRGMLDHSRKESGEAQEVDVNKLVSDFVDLAYHGLRGQDTSFNSAIDKTFDPDAGILEASAQDLSRVILNIANNAFQATHEYKQKEGDAYAPSLIVTTKSLGADGVEIRIRDNGPGMPDDVKSKIFEPFFTTKATGEGTGLGLSMTYDIVAQMHGGSLDVETALGEGACFIIRLPRKMPAQAV